MGEAMPTEGAITEIDMQKRIKTPLEIISIEGFKSFRYLKNFVLNPSLNISKELFADGSNLPAFLWGLKEEHSRAYEKISSSMRFIMPLFDDFVLEPQVNGATPDHLVRLRWRELGTHYVYQPWQMSDGALRALALITVLMQPDPPPTIIIDEPELGLHPNALDFLAGLMHCAAQETQLIVTTQSPDLLRTMEPEDVVVVHNRSGETAFERLEREPQAIWLEEYSLGELWLKNVIQAGPDHV